MMDYRTQQQMNDVLAFGMSLMFMMVMFGLMKSLISTALKPEKQSTKLLTQTVGKTAKLMTAQELVDSGLTGVKLSDAIMDLFEQKPEAERQAFLKQKVKATLWHGTRRREPIEELKKNGFCSYTKEQAVRWLTEAHKLLCEYTKPGPRVCRALDKHRAMLLYETSQPYRGKFSVTGIEVAACGEDEPKNLASGWADRNPEFVWDYLWWRANPRIVDKILTQMFGKPIKVKIRVEAELRQLLSPQDIHLEQRCFKPEEILSIEPCPPKSVKQLGAEIDQLWYPLVKSSKPEITQSRFPQVLIEGGEPVPSQYRYLVSWVREPLPEYSLAVELLPAAEIVTGERKIDVVLKQLKDGVESIQQSDRFRLFLSTMAKFHDYSIGNLILIAIQKPDATHVAGFNTWKEFGRWVKKGEKGISILAPVLPPRPTCPRCGAKLPRGARFCPECGAEVGAIEVEAAPVFFKVVYVFENTSLRRP